ncbi:hypothetical protein ACQKP0_04535 [Heyndrickxia sp. NPDC080065]|uniref:hypothetical protein n=1 Tax=Heyndrickxia sp. NPDC080065 TaxID=3390568 RepID=UPI003CFFF9DD
MNREIPSWIKLFVAILFIVATFFLILGKMEIVSLASALVIFISYSTRIYFNPGSKNKLIYLIIIMSILTIVTSIIRLIA